MARLPLFKYGRRARSTSLSIALCTMFIVASFSVLDGVRTSTERLKSNFEPGYTLVTKPSSGSLGYFADSDLSAVSGRSAFGDLVECEVLPVLLHLTVFSIQDPAGVLMETFTSPSGSQVLAGNDLVLPANVTLGSVQATVSGKFESAIFSPQWILANDGLVRNLSGHDGSNFAISKGLTAAEVAALRDSGFVAMSMTGIVDFLDASVGEVEGDTLWILIPSAFAIGVLAYSFVGSETADRRHEIGILKTIGAGRRKIMGYLMGHAAVISAWGGVLGVAFGIVLSYGVSTLASFLFSSVFIIKASLPLIIEAYVFTVFAGLAGAALPAARMTMTPAAEDLREVVP